MNYRLNPVGIAIVGILVVLAIGLFAYSLLSGRSDEEVVEEPTDTAAQDEPREVVTAMHDFADGVHTVAGELDVPTPCHVLNSEAVFVNGDPNAVEVRLTTATEEDSEMCAQVVTAARYKVSFEAPENATITASLNGVPVQFSLVEVPEGEDLADFELFIKG
jgi:hypothetical protein